MGVGEMLHVTSRQEFREWLEKHHKRKREVWLVFYRKTSGKPTISYEDAVEEALCYGWIDSQVRRIDEAKSAQRFTPRRKGSRWSKSNVARALKMLREGRMTAAGMAVLPAEVLDAWHKQKQQ